MSDNICFSKPLFFGGLIFFFIIIYVQEHSKNNNISKCPTIKCPTIKCPTNNIPNIIYEKRLDKIKDPLTPPTRKYIGKYNISHPWYVKPISTRGPIPQYQYIGNSRGGDLILRVYGRPTYPGSNKWEHYAEDPDTNLKYTLDFEKELLTNDTFKIREYGDTLHTFYENELETIQYNPYIFN